jgi:GNAT superfamily N-acetyltransferase
VHLAAPPSVAAALGLALFAGHGVVTAIASALDVLALNRVVGLGLRSPASEAQLDRVLAEARGAGARRIFVQVAPTAQPERLPDWLAARGGRPHNRWVRLWRRTAASERGATDLRVVEIDAALADAFARVVRTAFGMPPVVDPWLAAVVGRPGWRHFAAVSGDELVATGALFAASGLAWLGFAATLPGHRGRGAQSALIERRLREAAALGCEWAVTETAEELPDRPAPSYRNMRRLGFTEAYRRQNYVVDL